MPTVVVPHVLQRKPKYLLACLMERIQRGALLAMVLMRCDYFVISYFPTSWSRCTQTTQVQVLIEENLGSYLLIKKPLSSSYVIRV